MHKVLPYLEHELWPGGDYGKSFKVGRSFTLTKCFDPSACYLNVTFDRFGRTLDREDGSFPTSQKYME